MGEWSELYIGEYPVDAWKNTTAYASELFTSGDYVIGKEIDEEGNDRETHEYRTTAGKIVQRLDILGYSNERAKREFEKGKESEIQDSLRRKREGWFKGKPDNWDTPPLAPPATVKKFYSAYTYHRWQQLFRMIVSRRLRKIWFPVHELDRRRVERLKRTNIHLYHMLGQRDFDTFGFPTNDMFTAYRGMFGSVPPEIKVTLDFSSLVGWTEPEEYDPRPPKTVILTEGRSDRRILEASLSLLYPHLFEYFSFTDFESANMPGSSGHLVNMVKAFVATGVERRTIAIFDNDAAGMDGLRQLRNIVMPENIKVMSLPRYDFLKSYPTVGPQGEVNLDINGMAGSIELYLGRNVLSNRNGIEFPVRWGGWVAGIKRYQGEVIKKELIQERFFDAVSKMRNNPPLVRHYDWSGIKLIFRSIFDAFVG
jgi:hypothetical protein